MSCKACKIISGELICESSGDVCYFNNPDSKSCAEMYGIGPDSDNPILSIGYEEREKIIDEIIDEEGDFISDEDEIDNIAEGNFY